MKNIAILLSDPNSINQILFLKSLNKLKASKLKKIYLIGSRKHFIKIYNKILNNSKFCFINIKIKNNNFKQYLKDSLLSAIYLYNKKKIKYLINLPLNKKKFLDKKYLGFTEFFSNNIDKKKNENMLLYSKKFSVIPLTTHLELNKVSKNITKKKLLNCIKNIIFFYKKILKQRKIKIVILGLNPHASKDMKKTNQDFKIIKPLVNQLKKKIDIKGPLSADTAFSNYKHKIFIGMYHDQVLIPFKIINNFKGINITIGKKILRLSPDHGTAKELKNNISKINNQSFNECINFCEKY